MTAGIWKSGCAFLAPRRRASSHEVTALRGVFSRVGSVEIALFSPCFAAVKPLTVVSGAVAAAAASGGGGGGKRRRWCCSSSSVAAAAAAVHAFSDAQEWTGLQAWRAGRLNELRSWGAKGPTVVDYKREESLQEKEASAVDGSVLAFHRHKVKSLEEMARERDLDRRGGASSLAEWGALVLGTPDPVEKAVLTHHAFRLWLDGNLPLGVSQAPDSPARPAKPELVHPRKVPQPKDTSLSPSAHALHNLAHIELNAIDLAWDTVVRFSTASGELDDQFFADFAHVADDESRHCLWCLQRLSELGFSYGSMPAHNLLLKDCQKTSRNVMARLAVIPMMQEARGLDAGPRLVERLMGFGDARSATVAKHIAEEEVAHVAVGVSWFLSVCKQLGMNPASQFQDLMLESEVQLKGPFNYLARSTAGLPRDWYDSAYRKATVEAAAAAAVTTNREEEDPANSAFTLNNRQPKLRVAGRTSEQVTKASHNSEDGASNVNVSISKNSTPSHLPEVYKRLALVVTMEHENVES